jgi:hypothetical protein
VRVLWVRFASCARGVCLGEGGVGVASDAHSTHATDSARPARPQTVSISVAKATRPVYYDGNAGSVAAGDAVEGLRLHRLPLSPACAPLVDSRAVCCGFEAVQLRL